MLCDIGKRWGSWADCGEDWVLEIWLENFLGFGRYGQFYDCYNLKVMQTITLMEFAWGLAMWWKTMWKSGKVGGKLGERLERLFFGLDI